MNKQEPKKQKKSISSPDALAETTTEKGKIEMNEQELDKVAAGGIDMYMKIVASGGGGRN
jgi:hypothetical protein